MTATNIAAELVQRPQPSPAQIQCSECGACADAACNCGAPYIPAAQRAAEAIAANPQRSDRAIAAELGIGNKTVSRARQATVSRDTVEDSQPKKRIGKDGKQRRVPVRKAKKESAAAIEVHQHHAAERDRLDAEAVATIARLRETQADNEDVMALCDYIEWYIEGSPVWPACGSDMRIWRRTYRPIVPKPDETGKTYRPMVQKPDETPYTKMRRDH